MYKIPGTYIIKPKQNDKLQLHSYLSEFTGIEVYRLNL